MDPSLITLVAASTSLVGSHFALSHPLRAPLVRRLGELGFAALYSLVAFAALGWMVVAFRAAPPGDLGGSGEAGWIAATLLTLPALVLLIGSFKRNPALPGAEIVAHAEPHCVFRVTRHPMMWSFALWAIAHVVLWWSLRTLIVAGAVLILALVGAHLQDRKKRALLGGEWATWEAKTSYWPKWRALAGVDWRLWLGAVLAWLAVTYAHIPAADVPAGVWRWWWVA